MNILFATLLLSLGFALVVAEVFFPSLGALSILAVLSLGGSVLFAFRETNEAGYTFLAIAIFGGFGTALLAFKLLPRTAWGRKIIIAGPSFAQDPAATDPHTKDLLGKSGRALSMLRPAGIAEIDGRRVDCVTVGEMIEAGADVKVTRIEGNRVVVARASRSPESSPNPTP